MVNKKNWLGILIIVLVFGMTVVGCDDDSNDTPKDDRPMEAEWTMVTNVPFASHVNDIAFGGGKFIAVGSHEIGSSASRIASSTDGVNWSLVNDIPTGMVPEVIAYGSGRWVTNHGYSTDGSTWIRVDWSGVLSCNKIVYGNNKFVAVGSQNLIAYSSDGQAWTEVLDPPFVTGGNPDNIYNITFGDGKFIAVGGNKIANSTDGITWTTVSPVLFGSSNNICYIAYGGDKFVASNGDATAYSSDGQNWTPIIKNKLEGNSYSLSNLRIRSLTFGNGKWIGLYNTTTMAYSSDGINWSPAFNPPAITFPSSAIYGNGKFVAYSAESTQMAYSSQ